MSRIKEIEDYVKRLYESVETIPRGDEAKQLAADLTTTLGTSLLDKDIDYALSTLFNNNNGLIRFFYKAGSCKDAGVCSAVSIMFGFLVEFIPKRRKHLPAFQLYASDLKTQCVSISKTGNAISRAAAIDLLMTLIDKKNKFDTSEFDMPGLYRRYTDLYTLPKTKLPGGVKAKVIELLGKIARYYPEIPGENGLQMIKRWCFDNLTAQMKSSSPEGQIVAGCLFCLNNILYCEEENFAAHMNENSDKLFQIVFQVLVKYQDTTRYGSVQAALELFTYHTPLFATMLTAPNHWKDLFNILEFWASHHNPQTYKFGLRAFEQYIRQLSVVLHLNYQGALEQQIFRYVMDVFNKHLENADNLENFYNVSISIRGVGYFAKACSKIMRPEEKLIVRNDLIKISDWFYSSANSEQREYLRHIPAFIKAYTLFAAELDPIPVDLMDTLHKMCDIFVKGFINMSGYHRRNGVMNMRTLFGMLHQKGEGLFRNFLNNLFEQALLCTCTDIKSQYSDDRPAYNDLLYFWKVILNNPFENSVHIKVETQPTINVETQENEEEEENENNMMLNYNDTDVPEPPNLTDTLYDSFLLQVLKLTKNFNLKLKNISDEVEVNEESERAVNMVSTTLQPLNQKDFILFQNLVEFWCLILKELDNTRLEVWVYIVGTAIIDQSVLNPLVSGFYRMTAEIMIVCEKRQFFFKCKAYNDQKLNSQEHQNQKMPAEYSTYIVFREYLKEVWHRLQQFTDELLASCLRLILAYPIEFFDVDELITPLKKALKLGITYHPLATIAMNSLDKLLCPNLGLDISTEFLSQVLPCINEYLLVGVVSASKEGPAIKQKKYKVSTSAQRRYQTVHIKMTSDQLGVAKSDYSTLPDLQLRMMQFLGRLGGKNKQLLLQGNDSIQSNDMLAWDPVKRLKLRVPFRNSKIDIYLDEFLPRICELAEYSPDRQVKVAACELLHGLALFMIGDAAFQAKDSRENNESDYHKLYLRIFPVMLRLAIDPDQVARDMFRLLYAQLIHWLTNNAHSENPETMALLQTCLDAACSADAGLRDYGAECIREFVKWSIKQTSRSTDGAMNIKSLLKRLYNLMSNPNSTKRLGASLVFNRIYRLFREESVLVNEYTLEILGQLFLSLKMAEADHPSIGTRDQIIEAISHIKRILRAKVSVFVHENAARRPFIGSEDVNDLASVVEWTFIESGKIPRTYAKVCLNFFVEFVTQVPGVKSAKDWLKKAVAANPTFYVDIFETERLTVPIDIEDDSKLTMIYLNWIKRLNAAVDGYIWLIERDVLDPFDLCCNLDSHLINALQYFVVNTPQHFLQEKLDQSIIEKNRIFSIYSHISVRLIYFLHLMFESKENGGRCFDYVNRMIPAILYDENIMDLIARTLLMPKKTSELIQSDQGNAVTNSGVTRIFNVAKDYVLTMKEKSSSRFMPSLARSISKTIHVENINILVTAEYSSERSLLIEVIQTFECIKLLQSLDVLGLVCEELHHLDRENPSNVVQYCEALFDQYLRHCLFVQDPLFVQVLGNSVTIAFSQEGFAESYASELLGFSGKLGLLNTAEKLSAFQKYSEFIFECMAFHFEAFSPVLERHIDDTLVRSYVSMFWDYLQVDKQRRRKLIFAFSDQLVKDPTFLEVFVANSDSEDKILNLIFSLKLLFAADAGILSRSKRKPIFNILWNAFISFFEKSHPFIIKNSALDLLPVYICLDSEYRKMIINKLNESVVQNFPLETESLEKGTVLYNEYISYLDKLLDTMARFRSADIFNMLIGIFVQEKHHIHEEAIKKYLEIFGNGLGLTVFTEVTDTCFTEFKNTENTNLQRHNLCELMISLTVGVDDRAVIAFYEKNIEYILATIQREPALGSSKQLQDWNEKTDCLRLLQNLFDRLPDSFFTPNNVIYEKWINSPLNITKKRLVGVIIKANADLRKAAMITAVSSNDNGRREAQLAYNRAVSNALVSMMICVAVKTNQTDSIFKEDDHGKFIWDYIIDAKEEIYLKIQWDKPLVKSKLNELRALSGYSAEKNEQNIIYMASVALTGSSFTQSSLSDMVLESQTDSTSSQDKDAISASSQDVDTIMTEADNSTTSYGDEANEFELDVLNDNSFMKLMTELVKKLHEVIIKPSEHPTETPVWIKLLLKAFDGSRDQLNIQVYIAKLIDNYPFAFAPYASSWFLPLMEFVTKGGKFGTPMNYLVQDLCVILIVWGKNHELLSSRSETTQRTLYKFTEFLIKNAYHGDQRIMRSNIQIIKGVFENWGKIIPVPTRALYEQFTHTGQNKPQNIIGLQVLSIIFLNGGNPYNTKYSDIYDISEKTFYLAMASNITHNDRKKRDIAADTAELMGMTISYMRENNNSLLDELFDNFKDQLESLGNSSRHTSLHFLKCMNRVYLRDVPLARELMSIVKLNLRQYANVEKLLAMQFIGVCWLDDDMIYHTLESAGLSRMISDRDEKMQIAVLTVLNKIFTILKSDEIKKVVKRISKAFADHENRECRVLYYSFLKKAFSSQHDKDIADEIKALLFQGLTDKDKSITDDVYAYIEGAFDITDNIYDTVDKITREMYIPENEDSYLLYATCMVLNNTKKSYDFDQPIFDKPLPNARFDADYQHINTSWQNTSSMLPLFKATQTQAINAEDLELELNRTQSLLDFSITQGTNRSLLSTFNPETDGANNDEDTDSAATEDSRKMLTKTIKISENPYLNKRKRFNISAPGASNRFHSDRNQRLEKKMRNLKNTFQEISEKKVSLTRSYRVGELPDVQINYKDLLLPLEVLASADYNISRLLYSSLVVGIVSVKKTEDIHYESIVVGNIQRNINNSKLNFTPTIGSFLRIFFDLNITDQPESLVRSASSKSSNHHIGIALLEKQLDIISAPVYTGKRKYGDEDDDDDVVLISPEEKSKRKNLWIDLGLLYKEIDEPEIFQSVYLTNVTTEKLCVEAINYELRGQYNLAFNKYKTAAEKNQEDSYESTVWTEEMLYCYTQLCQWDDIYVNIEETLGDDLVHKIWEPKTKDKYFKYFVRSLSREHAIPPGENTSNNPVVRFYEEAEDHESHKEFLLKYYACEWSSVCILNKQYDLGSQIIRNSYDSLLAAWTTLHPLAHTSRLNKLSQLQRTVEIEDYLKLLKKMKQGVTTVEEAENFFITLATRYPDNKSDPIDVWDDLIDSRSIFIRDLISQNDKIVKNELQAFEKFNIIYNNAMADTAIDQRNSTVSSHLMKRLYALGADSEAQLCKIQLSEALFRSVPEHKKPELLSNGIKQASLFRTHYTDMTDAFRAKLIVAKPYLHAKNEILSDPTLFDKMIDTRSLKFTFRNNLEVIANADVFINYLESAGFDRLLEAGESIDRESSQYAEYLWKMGNYCDMSLKSVQFPLSTLQPDVDSIRYSKLIIKFYIEAMDKGYREAIENFPRVLDLIEQYPECGYVFEDTISNVDSVWRLIRWIPQLISFIETPVAKYILSTLTRIAESYPKAIYYHFQMYFEHYELKKDEIPKDIRVSIEKIRSMIRSPIMEEFTLELQRLTNPEHLLKDFTDVIKTMIAGQNPPASFIDSVYNQIDQLLLNAYSSRMGEVPKSFCAKNRRRIEEVLGRDGINLHNMTNSLITKLENINKAIYNEGTPAKKSVVLKSYSPWLASFKSSEFDEELEIPGQYDGLCKPYPELHAKVASFNGAILVMESIRKPKKIVIHGSDEKDYSFLVKGGEDLRLDQRIEQLFTVMNGMLKKDAFCVKQDIQIATYKVVPMSLSLGLIEWVDNTRPLKNCLEKDRKSKIQMKQASNTYLLWVMKGLGKQNSSHYFTKLFAEDHKTIIQNYNRVLEIVSPTLLKDTILQLSSSPEAFLFMRKRFAYSLACISIFGYILGIGDRHLENFLLNMKSGLLIPIDFGHAFGSATELLPVPEIVPFRLTPQIQEVLEPLGISGILENPMVTILNAIQNEKDLLLNIMNVFIKDPLLDWKKAAVKQRKIQKGKPGTSADSTESLDNTQMTAWYPQKKLEIVKRKLNKENPAAIVSTEIYNGHSNKDFIGNIIKMVKGDPLYDIRAQVGDTCKDTNEQVKCLINLATDKSVLGVMWSGWSSFL